MNRPLLIPTRPALDGNWCVRLLAGSVYVSELWAHLGPNEYDLDVAYQAFVNSQCCEAPDLRPNASVLPAIAGEKKKLSVLLADIRTHEANSMVREAYTERINELITTADMFEAALAGSHETFRDLNIALYGEPDAHLFAATVVWMREKAAEWVGEMPRLAPLAERAMAALPHANGSADDITPNERLFEAQRQSHFGAEGYFDQLFAGLPLPEGEVTALNGDPLVRRLLDNLGATEYVISDAPDSYWGVRASIKTVVRPSEYDLTAEEFIGLVGHEIGSHLLERLNGNRQPLRLLGAGLAGYEKGNEGRALLREQVAYPTWAAFAKQKRWFEILRRHMAVSLAVGLDSDGRTGRTFAEVFAVMNDLDLLWALAHGADDDSDTRVRVRWHTWELVARILKGTQGTGGAFYKDIVYLQGNVACWQQAQETTQIIRLGDQGKIDIANPSHRQILASMLA